MGKTNDENSTTIRVTRILKEEADIFVGKTPHPYTSITKLGDDALRNHLSKLKIEYPSVFKKGVSKK